MSLQRATEEFRALRRELEESILPLATSVDGRRFEVQSSLHGLELQVGGYVVVEGDRARLGQLLSLEIRHIEGSEVTSADGPVELRTRMALRVAIGHGVVLDGDARPFHDAHVRPATRAEVAAWIERTRTARARLEIGQLALAAGVPAELDAGGFDRHTFLCGQSGSGKTYSLGLVLERILAETSLRIVILDPNSDYVRLGELRDDADERVAARYRPAAATVDVRRAGDGLHLRLDELSAQALAAAFRLDPISDRHEYAELAALLSERRPISVDELQATGGVEARALVQRARNLGLDGWALWSRGREAGLVETLARRDARCLVVDLGSLATREERSIAAGAVLATLWHGRADREPVLVVIDEAHNVCSEAAEDLPTALATESVVQIAAEGRKFGLYLLVSTQRPQKVHHNIVSQCDNLLLMRMNSQADLGFLGDAFSFVPPGLLAVATDFRQGEALVAGKVVPHPCFVRFGARVAHEGGADIPSDWAVATE